MVTRKGRVTKIGSGEEKNGHKERPCDQNR